MNEGFFHELMKIKFDVSGFVTNTENLSISLTQEITFDAILVGEKKTDTKTIVSLSYNF